MNLSERRRQNFAVDVMKVEDRYDPEPGELRLSITYNGKQWTSVSLTPSEVEKVVAALKEAQI